MEKEYTIYSKLIFRNDDKPHQAEVIVPEDTVFLSNDTYRKIFGINLKESENKPWKRRIVKIVFYNDETMTHRAIYRMWKGLNMNYISKGIAYIDITGQLILFGSKVDGDMKGLELLKGSKFMFYWQHSNSVVRCSFKLGFVSVFLGAISLILGIISLI